jgi:hypothetical protein
MMKMLVALVASITLGTVGLGTAHAQSDPVEPTSAPQRIDGHIDSSASPLQEDSRGMQELSANQVVDNLSVRDKTVVLAGEVRHDVLAVDCDVTIKPTAHVGGHLVTVGGTVHNEAGEAVKVLKLNPGVSSSLSTEMQTHVIMAPNPGDNSPTPIMTQPAAAIKTNWVGAQIALLLFGLLGAMILLIAAPRAAQESAARVSLEPARCLVVGIVAMLAGLLVVALNAVIMNSALGTLYAPIGAVVALAPLVALGYGWLCGMRFTGDLVARKLGRQSKGTLFGRIALGLGLFALASILLGRNIGAVSLMLEFAVAVVGLGAVTITGGGTDPNWLDQRLSGHRSWVSFGRR